MAKNTDKYPIKVPYSLVKLEQERSKNQGILYLLFCYFVRYSSHDGILMDTVENIYQRMGGELDDKNRHKPKLVCEIINGIDFLFKENIIFCTKGDYHDMHSLFVIRINSEYLCIEKNFLCITIGQFDYLMLFTGRINKPKMFSLLFWILNCSTRNLDGKVINACAYSVRYMAEIMNTTQTSIKTYLSKLCGLEGSNAPLLKSNNLTMKINGDFKRFSNIYVKNDSHAQENIEMQAAFMKAQFGNNKLTDEFKDLDDYDELF